MICFGNKLKYKRFKIKITQFLVFIAMINIVRLTRIKKIITIKNEVTVQKLATIPHIIKIHINDTRKNKFQLKINDCRVDLDL